MPSYHYETGAIYHSVSLPVRTRRASGGIAQPVSGLSPPALGLLVLLLALFGTAGLGRGAVKWRGGRKS